MTRNLRRLSRVSVAALAIALLAGVAPLMFVSAVNFGGSKLDWA